MSDRNEIQGLPLSKVLAAGGAAGLAGGLAEVVFMGGYSSVAGINPAEILRLITFTLFDTSVAFGPDGLWAGLLIHFTLSLFIGVSFSLFARLALKGPFTQAKALAWSSIALTAIWAFNFFVLLPVYNADFVQFVGVSPAFFSKLSFGVVMALGIRFACQPSGTEAFAGDGAHRAGSVERI